MESRELALENLRFDFADKVEVVLVESGPIISQEASKAVEGWFKKDGGLHWGMIRASARRCGEPFKTRSINYRKGTIALNKDLAQPFRGKMAPGWSSVFFFQLPVEADRLNTTVRLALTLFLDEMSKAIEKICPKMSNNWNIIRLALERLIHRTFDQITTAVEVLLEKSRDVHRYMKSHISRVMREAYSECGAMSK